MSDDRPDIAAGHLFLRASAVKPAADRLVEIGIRPIVVRESFAVMELRGGTHIVLRPAEGDEIHEASFDFMVDDLDAARTRFENAGFVVGEIIDGKIHRGFAAEAPERFAIKVNDSHAGDRPV